MSSHCLFYWADSPTLEDINLQQRKTEKSGEISHLRSSNLQTFGIFGR